MKKIVQYDTGLLEIPCRSARDIQLFEDELPAQVKKSLMRHQISLEDAVLYVRTEQFKKLQMSRDNAAMLFGFLRKKNFIRRDINVRTLGYGRLLHKIGNDEYLYDLSLLGSNEEYETAQVVDWRQIERVDLMLDNRLKHRHQRIIRMFFGLDGECFSFKEIANSFKTDPDPDGPDEDKYPKATHLKELSDAMVSRTKCGYDIAICALCDKKDDRREYIAKLAKDLYDTAQASLKIKDGDYEKRYNDRLIESLTNEIQYVLRIEDLG